MLKMSRTLPMLGLAIAIVMHTGCSSPQADGRTGSPAKTDGVHTRSLDQSQAIVLAENGKANVVIVVPPQATNVTRFAAQELKTFLDASLAASIPIVEQPPANMPAIILGDNELSRKAGLDVKKLPRDGYYIKSVGDTIYIAGVDDPAPDPTKKITWSDYYTERATVFGVYEFLERFVGVRFYFPGDIGTVIPKRKELKVPGVDITDSPDYTSRSYSRDSRTNSAEYSLAVCS